MSLSVGGGVNRATSVLRAIFTEFRNEKISFMAGSIAYSAFVSLLPLLLLALLVATAVGGQALADNILGLTRQYLTPAAQELVTDALTQAAAQRAGFSILGFVVLLWSVLKVFRGLDVAFSSLYHTPKKNSIVDQVKDGLIVLGGIGIGVIAMVGAGVVVALLPEIPYIGVVSSLILLVALTIAFLPIYYVFPDVDVSVGDVLPGTIFAAVGWTLLQRLFQIYTTFSSTNEVYGVIGAVILLITWMYFAALVLLLGAAINVVLSGHSEAARPPPNPNGERSPE